MSLPADLAPRLTLRRCSPTPVRPDAAAEPRGVLHDVGHGLLTLSLLLAQASSTLRPGLEDDTFELLEQQVTRLLAAVHTGTRTDSGPVPIDVHGLLRPFVVVSSRTTLTTVVVRPGSPVVVHADAAALWRVMANLLDNAVRAAGPLGAVEIVVDRPNEHIVTIDVTDDGPGFQRAPSGVAQLGLTLVNRLLAAAGGRLEIHDVVPHGTRMRVVLPVGVPSGPYAS